MADPFANLLTSFKGGDPNEKKIDPNASLNTLASNQKSKSGLNDLDMLLKPKQTTTSTNTNDGGALPKRSAADDFEDLFGKPTNLLSASVSNNSTSSQSLTNFNSLQPSNKQNNDHLDNIMDVFNQTPISNELVSKSNTNSSSHIQLNQDDINVFEVDVQPDYVDEVPVIDEIKDMELAKLMSFGMSVEKANLFYDKGIRYEDVLRRRQQKRNPQTNNNNIQGTSQSATSNFNRLTYEEHFDDIDLRGNNYDRRSSNNIRQKDASSSLFSKASKFVNKGKELMDQFAAYAEEDERPFRNFNFSAEANERDPNINAHEFENEHTPLSEYEKGKIPRLRRKNEQLTDDDYYKEIHESNSLEHVSTALRNYDNRANMNISTRSSPAISKLVFEGNALKSGRSPQILGKDANFSKTEPNLIEGDLLNDFNDMNINASELQTSNSSNTDILLDFDNDNTTPTSNIFNGTSITSFQSNPNSKNITPLPNIAISTIELSGYVEFKGNGAEFFKNGDYSSALTEYQKSLQTLPNNHPLRIISYSNIIASQIKVGEYSHSLESSEAALQLFPQDDKQWVQFIQNSDPQRSYKDIWPKIMLRKAEAAEHLEKYQVAFDTYQLLLKKNVINDKIMAGKRRCQKVLNPAVSKPVRINTSTSTRKATSSTPSKNLQRVKEQNQNKEREEAQRVELRDTVDYKIEKWKDQKGDDIRHLLSTLGSILTWSNWKDVSAADLVMPKKVKITYMRAVAKIHPDKVSNDLSVEMKMLSEDIFSTLSDAWEKFKIENNIN